MRRGRLKKKTSDDAGGAAPEKPPTRSWRRVALAVAAACAAEVLSCRRRVPAPAGFDAERAATRAKVLASLGPRTVGERALDAGLAYALREARRVPDAEVEEWRSGRGAVDHAQPTAPSLARGDGTRGGSEAQLIARGDGRADLVSDWPRRLEAARAASAAAPRSMGAHRGEKAAGTHAGRRTRVSEGSRVGGCTRVWCLPI